MFSFTVLYLCILPFLSTSLSVQDCTTLNHLVPSLYQQYCCVEDNRGKSFILSDNEHNKFQYVLCPHETPASCSRFPTSCSNISTTATSGYYNIILANGTIVTVYCEFPGSGSCADIKNTLPDSPSGYYDIQVDGVDQTVYCNMDELCGDSGGWMRVGHLNMTDSSETCPPGFHTYDVSGIRACGRTGSSGGCQSVSFTTYGVNYTRVCGRVTGYQRGTPDAFLDHSSGTIDFYGDCVSITQGNTPRKHIWTYAASSLESFRHCPCDVGSTEVTPSFVGNDYFCETARELSTQAGIFYTDDLLWDGEQCGSIQEPCCEVSRNMTWFNKVLDGPSTDFIELRVCDDIGANDEDIAVNYYEIYIK